MRQMVFAWKRNCLECRARGKVPMTREGRQNRFAQWTRKRSFKWEKSMVLLVMLKNQGKGSLKKGVLVAARKREERSSTSRWMTRENIGPSEVRVCDPKLKKSGG